MKKKSVFRKISITLVFSLLIQLFAFGAFPLKVYAADDDSWRSIYYPGYGSDANEYWSTVKYRIYISSEQSSNPTVSVNKTFHSPLMIDGLNINISGEDTVFKVDSDLYMKNGAKLTGNGKVEVTGNVYLENGCSITASNNIPENKMHYYTLSQLYTIEGNRDFSGDYFGSVRIIPVEGYKISESSNHNEATDEIVVNSTQTGKTVYFAPDGGLCFKSYTLPTIVISPFSEHVDGNGYVISGTKSEIGDFYISDVTVSAPEGYSFVIKGETNSDGLPILYTSKEFTESFSSFEINLVDSDGHYVEGPIDGTIGDYTVPAVTIKKGYTAPETQYTLSGTKYKDKYFQSDVTLKPAEGYKVYTPDMIKADKPPVDSLKFTSTTKDVKIVLVDPYGFTSDEIKVGDIMILREDKGKIEADDCYLGGKLTVKVSADKRDPKLAKITYKDSEGKELKEAPSEIGKYTVIATFPDDDNYQEYVAKDDFEIKYLPTPTAPYSIEGTKGENEFYTTDVKIIPAEGYKISTTIRTGYTDSIALDKNGNLGYVYLQKKSTGEMTDKIAIKEIMIDKDLPVVTGISNNEVIYTDSRQIIVRDDNLEEVSVNGVKVGVSNGQAVIDLSADNGIMDYTIIMTDKAGNTSTIYVTLITAWMQTGDVQEGVPLKLYPGYTYNFPEGSTWTIEGDPTVYNGGNKFVVTDNVEIKFKKN